MCLSVVLCGKAPPPALKIINIQTLAGSLRNCSSHASGATLRSHVSVECQLYLTVPRPSCNLPCCDAIQFFWIAYYSAKRQVSPITVATAAGLLAFLFSYRPAPIHPFPLHTIIFLLTMHPKCCAVALPLVLCLSSKSVRRPHPPTANSCFLFFIQLYHCSPLLI